MPMLEIIRLTPSGRGAVASFLLCGDEALAVFLRHWQGKMPDEHPAWGRLRLTGDGDCEEAVVYRTAENFLEIHTHGGEQIAAAIETLFQRSGGVIQTWQEHFAPGDSQRELALRLLPFAPTERTAQILLDQYNGAYEKEIAAMERLPSGEQQQRRARLAQLASLGKHLVEPFRVVLAGASNAGKSTLLNAILGFQRSIVHAAPGTTRDVVSGQTALDGFPVMFLDTAGFRPLGNSPDDDLERQGIDRSMRSLSDADLVVWVIDPTTEESQRPACPAPPCPAPPCPAETNVLYCMNKKDLVPSAPLSLYREGTGVDVSALTGEGISNLLSAILLRLVPFSPQFGEAVIL